MEQHDLVIIGSGPAGYTAAVYAARGGLAPLMLEGYASGGLLMQTTEVENYPGFRHGIQGPALMEEMRAQAEHWGTELRTVDADSVALGADGGRHRIDAAGAEISARAVILATGSNPLTLGAPGETELSGRGVSYCATCDGAFFRDAHLAVVGGGDSAMEEAIFLTNYAEHVTVVHRRDTFRASEIMRARAEEHPQITLLTPYAVRSFNGDGRLSSLTLAHSETGEERALEVGGAFVAIGHQPQSALFAEQLPLDDQGYVIVDGRSSRTPIPGVFAAGDLIDPVYRQAITAAGSGCAAAMDAERYLKGHGATAAPRA